MLDLPIPQNIPENDEGLDLKSLTKKEEDYIKSIGIKIDWNGMNGWTKLVRNVESHEDGIGKAFLYAARGGGILHVGKKSVELDKGCYTIFNDDIPHSFELTTNRCTLLVINYKNGFPLKLMKSDCFRKLR